MRLLIRLFVSQPKMGLEDKLNPPTLKPVCTCPRARDVGRVRLAAPPSSWRRAGRWLRAKPKWKVRRPFLTINFDGFVADTIERHQRLTEAKKMVVEDPEILGGTPVIKGTRVPVYDIAASAEAGLTTEQIKDAYPSLDKNLIELAVLYAKATPARGRPRHLKPNIGASTGMATWSTRSWKRRSQNRIRKRS
jgi:uncharacterized protein (DUF433 family)